MSRKIGYGLASFLIIVITSSLFLSVFEKNITVKRKAVVVLLDGARSDITDKLIEEGKLVNLARLASTGVKAEYMLPVFPSVSLPGYSSIATGAYPGTTGITGNAIHLAGESLNSYHFTSNSQYLLAEPLWETAVEEGLNAIVISYPPSWPPTMAEGIIVSGTHAEISGSRSQLYVTPPLHDTHSGSDLINVTAAYGWTNAPVSHSTPLEAGIRVLFGPVMNALIVDTTDDGATNYDTVIVSPNKSVESYFVQLQVGEWSSWIKCTISGENSAFKLKLLQLSSDASEFAMYKTIPFGAPLTQPKDLRFELWNAAGPFTVDDHRALIDGWIDEETYTEVCEIANIWHLNATAYLMTRYDWELLFTAVPTIDRIEHRFMGHITPGNPHYNATTRQRYWNFIVNAYKLADQMVGEIIERAGDNASIFVVSDHGMAAVHTSLYANSILMNAGFLNLGRQNAIDWKTTKAYYFGNGHIYINLRDRDPKGIVPPDNYETVCQQIIQALYDIVDPNTGQRPVALAVKKSDAHGLGLYGDRVGDVIFSTHPNYALDPPQVREDGAVFKMADKYWTGQHGHLPYFNEVHSIFFATGPELRKEAVIPAVRAIDIASTLAYLLKITFPSDAHGSIIINALASTPQRGQ